MKVYQDGIQVSLNYTMNHIAIAARLLAVVVRMNSVSQLIDAVILRLNNAV